MTDKKIVIPSNAYFHLLWAINLISKQTDLSRLRFYAKPGMGIQITEIDSIEPPDQYGLHTIWINFGGIDGISGPLSTWLKELLTQEFDDAKQSGSNKRPLGDFINIFSHRLTYLLYRAWIKHRPYLMFNSRNNDSVSNILSSLTHQMDINKPDILNKRLRYLPYVASLGNRSRSAASLLGMLRHFFKDIPIKLKMFMKRYIDIPEENQMSLGQRLNGKMILGQRMADISGAFRIIIGPMKRDDFERFLPKGKYYEELTHLVQMFVSNFLEWDIELRLQADEIPLLKIGQNISPKLGFNTWLPSKKNQDGVIVL